MNHDGPLHHNLWSMANHHFATMRPPWHNLKHHSNQQKNPDQSVPTIIDHHVIATMLPTMTSHHLNIIQSSKHEIISIMNQQKIHDHPTSAIIGTFVITLDAVNTWWTRANRPLAINHHGAILSILNQYTVTSHHVITINHAMNQDYPSSSYHLTILKQS